MSITLQKTPTSIAITGGTNVVFASEGYLTNGKIRYLETDATQTDIRKKMSLTLTITRPKADKSRPGGFTMARVQSTLIVPVLLADNVTLTNNTVRSEIAFHPETVVSGRDLLVDLAVGLLNDSETRPTFVSLAAPA